MLWHLFNKKQSDWIPQSLLFIYTVQLSNNLTLNENQNQTCSKGSGNLWRLKIGEPSSFRSDADRTEVPQTKSTTSDFDFRRTWAINHCAEMLTRTREARLDFLPGLSLFPWKIKGTEFYLHQSETNYVRLFPTSKGSPNLFVANFVRLISNLQRFPEPLEQVGFWFSLSINSFIQHTLF